MATAGFPLPSARATPPEKRTRPGVNRAAPLSTTRWVEKTLNDAEDIGMTQDNTKASHANARPSRKSSLEQIAKEKAVLEERWDAFKATEPREGWEDALDALLNEKRALWTLWDEGVLAGQPDATPLEKEIAFGAAMAEAGFALVEIVEALVGDDEAHFKHGVLRGALLSGDADTYLPMAKQFEDALYKVVTKMTRQEWTDYRLREMGRLLKAVMPDAYAEAQERAKAQPPARSPMKVWHDAFYDHAADLLGIDVASLHRAPKAGAPEDVEPGWWHMVTGCMTIAMEDGKQDTAQRAALIERLKRDHGYAAVKDDVVALVQEFRDAADAAMKEADDAIPMSNGEVRRIVVDLQSVLFKAAAAAEPVEDASDETEPMWKPPEVDPTKPLVDDEMLTAWAEEVSRYPDEERAYRVALLWMRHALVSDNGNRNRCYFTLNPNDVRFPHDEMILKRRFADYCYTEWTKRGPKVHFAFDTWGTGSETPTCHGVRFNPRTTARRYVEKGSAYLNVYRGVLDPGAPDETADAVLDAFFEHLVPDAEEREWVIDWIANKYQQPWERMCSILMVADGMTGTGRGTLRQILQRVFLGQTTKVPFSKLAHSEFNGFLEDNLIVFCDEIGGGTYESRRDAAERIKDTFDPDHGTTQINRKHIAEYDTEVYSSGLWATNGSNALHLDPEDRRIAVITNPPRKLIHTDPVEGVRGETLAEQVYKTVGLDRLAAALARKLSARTVTRVLNEAPHFAGRDLMIARSENDVDEAIRYVVETATGPTIWPRAVFEELVKSEMRRTTGKVAGVRKAVSGLVSAAYSLRMGAGLSRGEVVIAGERYRQVVMTSDVSHAFSRLTADEKAAALYSGPTTDLAKAAAGVEAALKRVQKR